MLKWLNVLQVCTFSLIKYESFVLHIYFYVELQIHTTFCFSLVDKLTNCESETKIFLLSNTKVCNRDHLRFFDQVGHPTPNASIGNKHFFTKWWPRQTHQNYEQPFQSSQNFEFKNHFSVSKIGWIFPKKKILWRMFN